LGRQSGNGLLGSRQNRVALPLFEIALVFVSLDHVCLCAGALRNRVDDTSPAN
jgi:hypothetical protein